MKKIIYIILAAAAVITFTQCNPKEYLNVSNPSQTDDSFVTSSVAETFKTLSWCYAEYRQNAVAGGNYNWNDPCSYAEYYPEARSTNGVIGYLLPEKTGSVDDKKTQFNSLYAVIARSARVANILAEKQEVKDALEKGKANDWSQLYGEATTLYCWCYYELVRHFGDVPFGIENSVVNGYPLTSRFVILDNIIEKLKLVEPVMYEVGVSGITAERANRTFANLIIGEAALLSAGWQTIRTDISDLYGDVKFENKYTGKSYSYSRRTDSKTYYQTAQTYLRRVLGEAKGTMSLITSDERSYANNPFQRGFQYANDKELSPESIFEIGNMAPNQSERPYSQGRPTGGGGSNGAPCKVFGGIRINPIFYYTGYEDGDLRADASMVVTGLDGKGNEQMISFKAGAKMDGGISINKWDECRMKEPYYAKQRNTGLNYVMRRMSNVMLLLAEVDAELNESTEAQNLLNQLRDRAFNGNAHSKVTATGDALKAAVRDEVARELLGEGDLRWNMIRSGEFTTLAKKCRADIKAMRAGLKADGFYAFPNGKVLPGKIWTKAVKLDNPLTYDADPTNPALTPGWRGVFDYSSIPAVASVVSGTNHNLAIKGLDKVLTDAEIAALEADGYTAFSWGDTIADDAYIDMWDYNQLSGIELTDVPLYFHPIPAETLRQSGGLVTNGYGLPQE